jgi:pilus assembly protein FimV
MHAHVADEDQPEWREVVMMGEDLAPTHPLFGGELTDEEEAPYDDVYVPSTPHDVSEAAALEEFDLGTYVTGPGEDEPAVLTPQKHSEYHFNFDLTPVQRAEADGRPNAPELYDVDAPESPYVEAVHHGDGEHHEAASGASERSAAHVLDEETSHATPAEERATWAFNDDEHEASPVAHDESVAHDETVAHDDDPFSLHAATEARDTHIPPLQQDTTLRFDEPTFPDEEPLVDHAQDSFSDDPVDTKLDLARAYLDMGDTEGARLMLDEVMAEGSQMQKDTARRILGDIV